jgi:hypothetical protein
VRHLIKRRIMESGILEEYLPRAVLDTLEQYEPHKLASEVHKVVRATERCLTIQHKYIRDELERQIDRDPSIALDAHKCEQRAIMIARIVVNEIDIPLHIDTSVMDSARSQFDRKFYEIADDLREAARVAARANGVDMNVEYDDYDNVTTDLPHQRFIGEAMDAIEVAYCPANACGALPELDRDVAKAISGAMRAKRWVQGRVETVATTTRAPTPAPAREYKVVHASYSALQGGCHRDSHVYNRVPVAGSDSEREIVLDCAEPNRGYSGTQDCAPIACCGVKVGGVSQNVYARMSRPMPHPSRNGRIEIIYSDRNNNMLHGSCTPYIKAEEGRPAPKLQKVCSAQHVCIQGTTANIY